MKNFEIKSFVIGFLLAVVLVMASGVGANNNSTSNSFAVSAPSGGFFLVKKESGEAYIINEKGDMIGFGTPQISLFKLAE